MCGTLIQAIGERKRISSPRVTTSELTPSLVALDEAATLKRKEGEKDKLAMEKPQVSLTREGGLIPTAPTYGAVGMETSFSRMTEDSSSGLSAAVGGTETEQVRQQLSTSAEGMVTVVAPPSSIETRPKVVLESSREQGELPRRTDITREASREDALGATRSFFRTDPERRSATEVPVTTSTSVPVPPTDVPSVTSVPVAIEQPEPVPVRSLPYSGTPPRLTATATLRPRTWVQRVSEGQIERQPQDEDSEEDDTLEPLVMEGLPDELGPEWRVLHPFEIPGVRNPTEDTPPTHRRLAENDTLVELIQTAECLEDVPSWEQRRFYPPWYGDPYYRGRGRGSGRGRGRGRGWLNEHLTDR